MEKKSIDHRKGEILIREIVNEYRNLFELLEDPQIIVNGNLRGVKGQVSLLRPPRNEPLAYATSSIEKLSTMFSQLKECYNNCVEDYPFDLKVNIFHELFLLQVKCLTSSFLFCFDTINMKNS